MASLASNKTDSTKAKSLSSSSDTSTSVSTCDLDLKKQLYSTAWVQCDNATCLKWRKVTKEKAEKLADKTWTCNMNEDPNYQSCSAPEEDTASFDRLAKKAKFDLIKSEIKAGSLVWAKMDGYCRWPALITPDPACGIHMDGDGEKILWYHVEYLGDERSHGWLRTNRVEIFGPGNCQISNILGRNKNPAPNKSKRGRKRGKAKMAIVTKKEKLRNTYKGSNIVQKAVAEAISLLSLSPVERLKTCWFVANDTNLRKWSSFSETKKEKRGAKSLWSKSDQNSVKKTGLDTKQKPAQYKQLDLVHENKTVKARKRRKHCDLNLKKPEEEKASLTNKDYSVAKEDEFYDKEYNRKSSLSFKKAPAGLIYLQFPSSLVGSSKEERFILDVQIYKRNEKIFEDDVKCFMSSQDLSLSPPPVWQNVRVNIFNIFLAVYERGGFELVCDRNQWGSVYSEVTHQQTSRASVVKRFYRRNLYPYELFVTGQDYSLAVRSLQQTSKLKEAQAQSTHDDETQENPEDSGCSTMSEAKGVYFEESEPSVSGCIETLDEILLVLGEDKKDGDRQVPDLGLNDQTSYSPLHQEDLVEQLVDTASGAGKAVEPEENAQVVPELDFPSSVESSERSSGLQDFHEMQALQMDLGDLNNQLNII